MPKSPEGFMEQTKETAAKEKTRGRAELEVYDNNKAVVDSMQRAVGVFDLPPAAMISLQYSEGNQKGEYLGGKNYEELKELIQKKVEKDGTPVILSGFDSLEHLTRDSKFYELLGYKKVGFMQQPIKLAELAKLIAKLNEAPNIKDDLAFEIGNMKSKENMISHLRHDLGHPRPENRKAIISMNKIYGTNFDPEKDQAKAYEFISHYDYKADFGKEFEGKKLSGVFCDVEGTLIDSATRKVNAKILEKLDEYDKKQFVRVWTGGNMEDARKFLAKENRAWMLLSKNDFHGSRPEVVIDDLSANEFKKEYGIKPQTFIRTYDITQATRKAKKA